MVLVGMAKKKPLLIPFLLATIGSGLAFVGTGHIWDCASFYRNQKEFEG